MSSEEESNMKRWMNKTTPIGKYWSELLQINLFLRFNSSFRTEINSAIKLSKITIKTFINAAQSEVFDLARNIDVHASSMSSHNEEAIGGVTSGLIELNDSVTWRATHFGIPQTLTSKITSMENPITFTDEMVAGAFKSFNHKHLFEKKDNGTLMTDIFVFKAPFGILGKLFTALILKRYMRNLLAERNAFIKSSAEAGQNPSN